MNDLTTAQLGRLIALLRDTEIPDESFEWNRNKLEGVLTTNLIKGNEDIFEALSSEFIRRVDEEAVK